MKKSTNPKTKLIAITAIVLMITAMLLGVIVHAQDEGKHGYGGTPIPNDWNTGSYSATQPSVGQPPAGVTVDATATGTVARLSFRPNPVGVGQTILVNVWINPALPGERFNKDYKITVTDPEGNEDVVTVNSYCADTTSWFEYSVDQIGEWTLKFDFEGMYFPAGMYYNGYIVTNDTGALYGSAYYPPASTSEQTLVVQEEQVLSWPPDAIPTDYWTYPVSVEHREWWPILGAWPADGYVGGGPTWDELYPNTNTRYCYSFNFAPWVQAPNSAHIVWKRLGSVEGMIGGPAGIYSQQGSAGGPSVLYAGRAYQTYTKPGVGSVAACYDIRTGEVYYEIPTSEGGVTPEYVVYDTPSTFARGAEVPGALARLGWGVDLINIGGGRLIKIDPFSGAITLNVSIAPLTGGGLFYNQYDGFVLDVRNIGTSTNPEYRLINWTTTGNSIDFEDRILSNTSYARSALPVHIDWETGIGFTSGEYMPYGLHVRYGNEFWLIDVETGETLYHIITDHPDTKYSTGGSGPVDHGKVIFMTQRGYPICFDVYTGEVLWRGTPLMDYPWGESSFGAYDRSSAYGMYYWATYDGIYAWNWTNGEIVWNTKAPALAHYESPYITDGVELNPFRSTVEIADGKVFSSNIEHTETNPYTRGWGTYAMDAFTGDLIWNVMLAGNIRAIAEGYLFLDCSRDGTMYVIGMGKSETTISAPQTSVPQGTAMMITGSVLDMSPAQPGTPCVSKDSMTTQMAYIHSQMPIDGLWHNETITGVPVTLTAIHEDGTVYDLGTTTTNGYYGTFGKEWTPEKEGKYEVIANFGPDESYGSSADSTFISVGPAPSGEEPPIEEPVHPIISTEAAIIIGVVVIAAIAIIAYVVMRRPKK